MNVQRRRHVKRSPGGRPAKAKGLAEYRRGRYREALDLFDDAQPGFGGVGTPIRAT
jgi:hypothetical protein